MRDHATSQASIDSTPWPRQTRTMRILLALALVLMTAACATREPPRAPGADVWGELEAGLYGEIGELRTLRVAPPEGSSPDLEMESVLRQSLARRGYDTPDDTPLVLRYLLQTAVTDAADDGLGVMFSGALGSGSGVNDFGIGLDLPILGGGSSVRRVAFLFELRLEGPDGALLWRGRAVGRTHLSEAHRIARPLAPLLIERLGRDTPARRFSR